MRVERGGPPRSPQLAARSILEWGAVQPVAVHSGGLAGDDLPQLIDDFENRIHFAHLRDQIGNWESFEEVFPGEGEYEVAGLVRKLRDSGYTGMICPEHWGPSSSPDDDPEARAVAYLRETLAE